MNDDALDREVRDVTMTLTATPSNFVYRLNAARHAALARVEQAEAPNPARDRAAVRAFLLAQRRKGYLSNKERWFNELDDAVDDWPGTEGR